MKLLCPLCSQPSHSSETTERAGEVKHSASAFALHDGDFPGGPLAKTLCSQCEGPGFDLWLGNWIPHATTKDPACHS